MIALARRSSSSLPIMWSLPETATMVGFAIVEKKMHKFACARVCSRDLLAPTSLPEGSYAWMRVINHTMRIEILMIKLIFIHLFVSARGCIIKLLNVHRPYSQLAFLFTGPLKEINNYC